VWKETRSVSSLSSSFNTKIVAQDNLRALWTFNETGSLTDANEVSRVNDSSGFKLNGNIINYYSGLRMSGSILPYDKGDPIISLNSPEVVSYIAGQQTSGSAYDRDNDNIITRLVPEQFLLLEEYRQTHVLENFLYVLARYFDQLKVSIDQFAYVLSSNHGEFDQTPEALLKDVAKFFGWEFTGNFLNSDAIQYIVGKQVLANTQSNQELDVKLFEIKNEFWKRTLVELMHIYKTKGTRESVESLLRVYGIDPNVVRLKEYGFKRESKIETHRIRNQKSVNVIVVGSGSYPATIGTWDWIGGSPSFINTNNVLSASAVSIEGRFRFPTDITTGIPNNIMTGSLWNVCTTDFGTLLQEVFYAKDSVSSMTGNLFFTGSFGTVSLNSLPIFDGKWYNISTVINTDDSIVKLSVKRLEEDVIIYSVSTSSMSTVSINPHPKVFAVGSNIIFGFPVSSHDARYWCQEFRVWNKNLSEKDINDHALNFQSFGREDADRESSLVLHWRFNDGIEVDSNGQMNDYIHDFSGNNRHGAGRGFLPDKNPFKKFLLDYNFIAPPEYGWNDEKIRSFESSTLENEDLFVDSSMVGLEFNLVDALNEDISQIISTLDNFNEFIGNPANVFRDSYPDLDVLRENYFRRLQGKVNFRLFADMLEFFDKSFVSLIQKLLPARAIFLGDEFVVESHMLERSKWQKPYRRREIESIPEGTIQVFIR
jgi:hypothetical protein